MPQPDEVTRLAEQLIALFRDADAEITRLAAEVATAPAGARRRARLAEMRRTVEAHLAQLETDTAAWLARDFPTAYQLGGDQGAGSIGEQFSWSQVHVDAVQQLASDTFDDVLTATGFVRADVKAWIREQGRRQTAFSLIEGRTAQQAARELTKAAAGQAVEQLGGPVGVIRYADGSYRQMADYADMLLRTKTAQAFNAGTLNTLTGFGVEWCEVLDGTGCGWTSHADTDKANGTVRRAKDCYAHSLSHPRCRRSFIGRPDITSPEQAGKAKPTTTAAQRADQAQAEADRAAALAARRRSRDRASRPPRQPREVRQRRARRSRNRQATVRPQRVTPTGGSTRRTGGSRLGEVGVTTPTGQPWDLPPPTAGTRTDAEAWLTAKWGVLSDGAPRVFDFVGCADDYTIAAAGQLDDLFKRYPTVADRIEHIGSFASRGVTDRSWGISQRNVRYLLVNEHLASDFDYMSHRLAVEQQRGWLSSGDPMTILVHEFGHHVHYLAETRAWVALHGGDPSGAYFFDDWLKAELDPIIKSTLSLKGPVGLRGARTDEAVKKALSRYGVENYRELCAEGWTEYVTARSRARPLAKAIGRWLEAAVR